MRVRVEKVDVLGWNKSIVKLSSEILYFLRKMLSEVLYFTELSIQVQYYTARC